MRSDALGIGLLFVALTTLALLSPVQSDTWWLLRAGHEIWATGQIPFVDAYSFTASGRYWWNHEWLSEASFYLVFRLGGFPLLVSFCAAAIVAGWVICWRLTRGVFEWRLAGMTACLVPGALSWAIRPQVFSMLLFVTICAVLTRDQDSPPRRPLWFVIPAIVAVWVNLHGTALLALPAIAGALAGAALWRRTIPWPLVWTLLLSALAICASPVGVRMYSEIPASIARSRMNALIEWLPPDFSPAFWPFWALAAGVVVTVVLRARRIDERTARLLGIAVAVLPLAIRSTRNVQPLLLAGLPAVTSAWAGAPRVVKHRGERERVNAGIVILAACLAAIGVGIAWRRAPAALGWRPIGPAAVRALEDCHGRLYNTYRDGGVLIWFAPSHPVFVDNRQDPYPDDLLQQSHAIELGASYDDVFRRYDVGCAAVTRDSPMSGRLAADPGWSVTHQDARWIILARKPAKPSP